ncbi:MAG: ATP-binding protein [Anaerolineae bacterium]|nr:ATP-binding protein [Anaerolineae bacterium]
MVQPQRPQQREGIISDAFVPAAPRSIEETGLNLGLLSDLALKILYFESYLAGRDLAERMGLPFPNVIAIVLEFLKREKLCEVRSATGRGGFSESSYEYILTERGRDMARDALDRCQYAGIAPVPLAVYIESVRVQGLKDVIVHQRQLRQAMSHLIFSEHIFEQIGPAVNSGRSVFLFGAPGNGKTSIAEAIGSLLMQGDMYIPYAVEIEGQIIQVFDLVNHVALKDDPQKGVDIRWCRIRRPFIIVGGELTMESLDLVYNADNKFYEAPFQMKANGGIFLIDDFGRQQVRPRDLLNRWIVPLEKRIDFLTLHTGRKFEIPFEALIVFSTNLEPKDLVDEAFLRRIRHKIEVKDPTWAEFAEIFKRVAAAKKVTVNDAALKYLVEEHYIKAKRPPRACHARDLLDQVIDISRYLNVQPTLSRELLDRAAESYFVEL